MADQAACPQNSGAGHCWHTVWVQNPHQSSGYVGSQMRCCWCGETKPLTATYVAVIPHGQHKPADVPPPIHVITYHEPRFGHGGIPLPDEQSGVGGREP